jgi:ferredoxin-NADP reductase
MLGKNFINILSDEIVKGYENGKITEEFLQAHIGGINQYFYVCGQLPMMDVIEKQLTDLHINAKSIVKEEF